MLTSGSVNVALSDFRNTFNLHMLVCAAGAAHTQDPMGKHPCQLAFVVQLSKLLREAQEGFLGEHDELGQALKVNITCPWLFQALS